MTISRSILFTGICLSCLVSTAYAEDASVTVPTETWMVMTYAMPNSAFSAAHESIIKHDWKAAAAYVHSAAAYTEVEAQHASGASADALKRSATELASLADKIKSGGDTTLHDLDKPFADTEQALSSHYRNLATRAHESSKDVRAGHYIERAGDSLRAAASWSGQKLDAGAAAVVHETRKVGSALADGTSWALSKAGDLTVKLGEATEALGERM